MINKLKNLFKENKYRMMIFTLIGALAGYGYYYFIGCRTGTCPITSNWYISTLYGAVMGLVLGYRSKKDRVKSEPN